MSENIPKPIQEEFTILNKNIKYPTYPDQDFQNSILEDINLNNYSPENIKKSFQDFYTIFTNCKNITYKIIEKNLHNFQEYCLGLNEKAMTYVFYFYIIEKFANLVENKFFKIELNDNQKKELFFDDIIIECCKINENFEKLYKNEFKEQNEISHISHDYIPILEKYNILLKNNNEIGIIIVRTIKFITKYIFLPLEEELNKFTKIENFYEENFFGKKIIEENEIILLDVILKLKKLANLDYAFFNASILDKNDICNQDENSKDWENLEKILFRIVPKNAEELRTKMLGTQRSPDLPLSIMSNIQVNDSAASLMASGLKNLVYYKANENRAKIDSKRFQISNSLEKSMGYIGLVKKFKFIFTKWLPSIEFRRKIYVKKELPPINRIYIEKLINFMKKEKGPLNSENILTSNNNNNIDDYLPIIYRDKVPDKNNKRNYVSVTILHKEKIYFKDEKDESMFSSLFGFFKSNEPEKKIENKFRKNTIIIAIHGGGFIGSSTLLHERYLRKWSNMLNIPIFGMNYSLAPKYQYPEPLNDIYQGYMWILKHAKEELNMDIKHIILSGDSAGGNIVLGLNNLLIAMKEYEPELGKNIILPELVMAQYPVTYVNPKTFSNSFLLSLHSSMLNINGMKFMYEKYVGKYENEDEDPFLNLIKINDFILDRITNKIRIFFGSQDVLRDDAIKFLYSLSKYNNKEDKKNNIDVRGYELLYLGHGFNGFNEEIQQIGRNVVFPEIEDFLNNISE